MNIFSRFPADISASFAMVDITSGTVTGAVTVVVGLLVVGAVVTAGKVVDTVAELAGKSGLGAQAASNKIKIRIIIMVLDFFIFHHLCSFPQLLLFAHRTSVSATEPGGYPIPLPVPFFIFTQAKSNVNIFSTISVVFATFCNFKNKGIHLHIFVLYY